MRFLQVGFFTSLLVGLILSGCGMSPAGEVVRDNEIWSSTDRTDNVSRSVGQDVTSEYIENGEDTRVSPKGKTRSSLPDEIVVCEVEYRNYSSGRRTTYTLEVDFEDGRPKRINWPNGGWKRVESPYELSGEWHFSSGNARYTIRR